MTSTNDITMILVSDGEDWREYLSDTLDRVPQINHNSIILDTEKYDDLREKVQTCRHSVVSLLIVTSEFLDFMSSNAVWFSRVLREVEATSTIIPLLLLDRKDLEDVSNRNGYVTSEWVCKDMVSQASDEVQQRIAEVLNVVEERRKIVKKPPRIEFSPSTMKRSPPVEFFPSTVYQRGSRVAMLFEEAVEVMEVILKLRPSNTEIIARKETDKLYIFTAPSKQELESGTYKVMVYVDKKRLIGRVPELTFSDPQMASFTSPEYLTHFLRLKDQHELDLHLKETFNNSLLANHSFLGAIFSALPKPDADAQQKNADTLFPTILHYAAAHGLSEFCTTLLKCPGGERACQIRNCQGKDPIDLAGENGFEDLEIDIIDYMANVEATEEDGYLTVNPEDKIDENLYMTMSPPHTQYKRSSAPGGSSVFSQPELPPRPEIRSSLSSEADLTDLEYSPGARPDRPPLAPPRKKSGSMRFASDQHPTSPVMTTVHEDGRKAFTLPPGTKLADMWGNQPYSDKDPAADMSSQQSTVQKTRAAAKPSDQATTTETSNRNIDKVRELRKLAGRRRLTYRERRRQEEEAVTLRQPRLTARRFSNSDNTGSQECAGSYHLPRDSGIRLSDDCNIPELGRNETDDSADPAAVILRTNPLPRASSESHLTLRQQSMQRTGSNSSLPPPVPPRHCVSYPQDGNKGRTR